MVSDQLFVLLLVQSVFGLAGYKRLQSVYGLTYYQA